MAGRQLPGAMWVKGQNCALRFSKRGRYTPLCIWDLTWVSNSYKHLIKHLCKIWNIRKKILKGNGNICKFNIYIITWPSITLFTCELLIFCMLNTWHERYLILHHCKKGCMYILQQEQVRPRDTMVNIQTVKYKYMYTSFPGELIHGQLHRCPLYRILNYKPVCFRQWYNHQCPWTVVFQSLTM